MVATIKPGLLTVASAYPDPPFDVSLGETRSGFDVELMGAICRHLGVELHPVAYTGSDFDGIFDGLASGAYDAVISGATITQDRERVALFSEPYLEFGQGVAVNRNAHPHVSSTADLRGLVAGIQQGNTSDIVARKLVADGILASIKYYPYDGIPQALDDLEAERIGLIIKLHPVICQLTKERPVLVVPLEIPTHERLGIAFKRDNTALCAAVNTALATLRTDGSLAALTHRWI